MSLKRYQNELIVLGAFLFMFSMYLYKQNAMSSQSGEYNSVVQVIEEIKEVNILKKVWADKNIIKKIEKIKTVVPASKVKWNMKGKKFTAVYKDLKPSELNKLTTKVLNTAVVIDKVNVEKTGTSYKVELKCRW